MLTITTTDNPPATHPVAVAGRTRAEKGLRVVLTVLGLLSAFVAINVALGGIETLGLQGSKHFVQATDQKVFDVRDSHTHYYGGVYFALGVFLVIAAGNVRKYRSALTVVLSLMVAGGLARLSQGDLGVTFGKELAVSTLIELVAIPLLIVWVRHTGRANEVA